jgi:ribosome biogenesis GTPase
MPSYEGIISSQHREVLHVFLPEQDVTISARPSGKLRRQTEEENTALVTGDRVTVDRNSDSAGSAVIQACLERRSILTRAEAGGRGRSQPLAANIDLAFICTSLNEEFNIKRLDRYLAMADGAGVPALLLLTKADTAPNPDKYLDAVMALQPPRKHILCSALTGLGVTEVRDALWGKTAVLLGSSGVGKSSIINALLGEERLRTAHLSGFKDKGRHTTTSRELIPIADGYLIDTPGMRELRLDNSDAAAGFGDIADLALRCRFSDCAHGSEPGCSVRLAILEGRLGEVRLDSFLTLKDEEERRRRRK